MNSLRRHFDHWLFEEYKIDAQSLGLFRIVFSAYVLANELPTGLWTLPQAAYNSPLSPAALFTHYPPHWVMVALNAATMVCASSLLIGLYTVASSLGLALGTVLIDSFAFADGKIDEGLLLWVAVVLAFSGWGDALSVDRYRRAREPRSSAAARDASSALRRASSLAALALLVGLALFTAGSAKARGGWLHLDTLGTRYHLFWDYFVYNRKTALATWAWQSLPHWGWKLGDWGTVLWESTFVLAAFRRSWCRIACAVGALFHFGVWMLFDIRIASNVIAYGAFVSWALVFPGATAALAKRVDELPRAAAVALCSVPFVFSACSLFLLGGDFNAALSLLSSSSVLCIGLCVALGYLALQLRSARSVALAPLGD